MRARKIGPVREESAQRGMAEGAWAQEKQEISTDFRANVELSKGAGREVRRGSSGNIKLAHLTRGTRCSDFIGIIIRKQPQHHVGKQHLKDQNTRQSHFLGASGYQIKCKFDDNLFIPNNSKT